MEKVREEREVRIKKLEEEIKEVHKKFYGTSEVVNTNFGSFMIGLLVLILLISLQYYLLREIYWKSSFVAVSLSVMVILGKKHERYTTAVEKLEKELYKETNNPLHAVKKEAKSPKKITANG